MKQIFGAIPIDHLSAAQILAKRKQTQVIVIVGFVAVAVAGIYIGYRISENKRKFDITPPKPDDEREKNTNAPSGKFRYSTASNFSAKPVGVKSKRNSKFEPNLDSYLDGTEND